MHLLELRQTWHAQLLYTCHERVAWLWRSAVWILTYLKKARNAITKAGSRSCQSYVGSAKLGLRFGIITRNRSQQVRINRSILSKHNIRGLSRLHAYITPWSVYQYDCITFGEHTMRTNYRPSSGRRVDSGRSLANHTFKTFITSYIFRWTWKTKFKFATSFFVFFFRLISKFHSNATNTMPKHAQ